MKLVKKIKQMLMPKQRTLQTPQQKINQMEAELEALKAELALPNQPQQPPVEGDGKAVFIELGTDEEYEDYVMKEERGWGNFIKKVFNPNDNDETNSDEDISASEGGADSGTSSGEEGRD